MRFKLGLFGLVPLQLSQVGNMLLQFTILEICYQNTSFPSLDPHVGYVSSNIFCIDEIAPQDTWPDPPIDLRILAAAAAQFLVAAPAAGSLPAARTPPPSSLAPPASWPPAPGFPGAAATA